MTVRAAFSVALSYLVLASPARAELPGPVKDMVHAAIATGDARKVDTVIELARQTNPGDAAELDSLQAGFNAEQARRADAAAKERERKIRSAGVFDNWSGRIEAGASRSTGNTDYLGLNLGLDLNRKGIEWQHHIRVSADLQRSDGVTNREKYLASWEPRYNISRNAFLFGIGQYEHNEFQGFSSRYALSGGLGYRVVDNRKVQLSLKAGPAWRRTEFLNGRREGSLAGLAGFDFDWALSERLKFTQDANMVANAGGSALVVIDANNTTVNLVSGLEAKVSNRLTTRFSYSFDYDSNPPPGAEDLDTLTRMTLIYGF